MVSKAVESAFHKRLERVLSLIHSYGIVYDEVGVFGSYARNDYKSTSDIDFCIITTDRPPRAVSGSLRSDAELLKADIIYVTRDYFENDSSLFAKNLRRDYKKL